jgi:hypothetical protein
MAEGEADGVKRRFRVPANVTGKRLRDAPEPGVPALCEDPYTTARENVFDLTEVVVDPLGKAGIFGPASPTVGGRFAREGYYGFKRTDRADVLLVHGSHVEVL